MTTRTIRTNGVSVSTHFADMTQTELQALAETDDAKFTVNMLRHECTTYDAKYSLKRFVAVNQAIAKQYPWLADECERQIRTKSNPRNLWRNAGRSRNCYF